MDSIHAKRVLSKCHSPLGDLESILDVFTKLVPGRMLKWHYRSKHESLIAFSNQRYYDGNLIIFPAVGTRDGNLGIRHHYIEDGIFTGKPGRNIPEARAVAKAIVEHVKRCPRQSLGVAAMSLRQRDAIEDELDNILCRDPAAERAVSKFNASIEDPIFIKNLETVQGDERDVIFISCTYGPDAESGRVFQRFGPVNNDGGERRLNVLFTRSRMRMEIFTSMRPNDITAGPSGSQGARDLRAFLAYAEIGKLVEEGKKTDREPDSDFEVAVATEIRRLGYRCTHQVGVAGFFIDIGVHYPGPTDGEFCLGIECDGATYHSSRSARDRDRLREEVIRSRGWNLHRVWSTDWFLRREDEIGRLKKALECAAEPPRQDG
jgi:very-short-patch-repair endonuclease